MGISIRLPTGEMDRLRWKQRAIDILKLYRARDIAANKKVV